jgi:hypothetical protein
MVELNTDKGVEAELVQRQTNVTEPPDARQKAMHRLLPEPPPREPSDAKPAEGRR